jgi:ribosome-binding factor A
MSGRMRRVDTAVREVLGEAIAQGLKDPRIGFVTVTDVETSGDLQHARVFVSLLGDPEERQASVDGLNSAAGLLQRRVATQLRMKRTPTLTFLEDPTARRAARVDEILASEPEAPPS